MKGHSHTHVFWLIPKRGEMHSPAPAGLPAFAVAWAVRNLQRRDRARFSRDFRLCANNFSRGSPQRRPNPKELSCAIVLPSAENVNRFSKKTFPQNAAAISAPLRSTALMSNLKRTTLRLTPPIAKTVENRLKVRFASQREKSNARICRFGRPKNPAAKSPRKAAAFNSALLAPRVAPHPAPIKETRRVSNQHVRNPHTPARGNPNLSNAGYGPMPYFTPLFGVDTCAAQAYFNRITLWLSKS